MPVQKDQWRMNGLNPMMFQNNSLSQLKYYCYILWRLKETEPKLQVLDNF